MGGYNHSCRFLSWDTCSDKYEISWTVDIKYHVSEVKFFRTIKRITNYVGAKRFCKKWDISLPEKSEK